MSSMRQRRRRLWTTTLVSTGVLLAGGWAWAGAKGVLGGGAVGAAAAVAATSSLHRSSARSRTNDEDAEPDAGHEEERNPGPDSVGGGAGDVGRHPAGSRVSRTTPLTKTALRTPAAGEREPLSAPDSGEFPVLATPSRAARAPWRLPASPAFSGIAADQARLGGLEVRAASIVGPGHRCQSPIRPRQDAYRVAPDLTGTHLVVAVADGMSDSAHSEAGASVAVGEAVARLRTELTDGTALERLDTPAIFLDIARKMSGYAAQRDWSEDDVRTGLLLAVVPGEPDAEGVRRAWLASLADITAWRLAPASASPAGAWEHLIGDEKHGFDAGRLDHFLPYHPREAVSRTVELRRGEALALLTDGVADAFSTVRGGAAWFGERWRRPPPIGAFILHVGYENSQCSDDRTAVVVWCSDASGSAGSTAAPGWEDPT